MSFTENLDLLPVGQMKYREQGPPHFIYDISSFRTKHMWQRIVVHENTVFCLPWLFFRIMFPMVSLDLFSTGSRSKDFVKGVDLNYN